jgi:O-antigen/teichoic acid export membrane protein
MTILPFLRRIESFGMDHHMKEVVRGTTTAFILKALGTGLSFGFNIILARLLGAKGAGVYYLALTVTTIASVVGRLGLDNTLLRFTAANAEQKDWDKVAGIYRMGIRIAVGASILVTLIILISASWIAQGIFSEETLTAPLRLMAFGILPMSLLILHAELLKGLKRIRDAMMIQSVGLPMLGVPLLAILGVSLGLLGAAVAYVISAFAVLLLGIGFWRRATPQLRNLNGCFDIRLLISTSLPLFWVTSMNLVMSWTDIIMLGIWTDSKTVGIYGVAARTAMLTSFILPAVNSIVAPKFAGLYAQKDYQSLSTLARNSAQIMTCLAAPVLLLFVVAPKWVLGFFGTGFISGANVLVILAIGQFVNVSTGSVGYLLMMSGYEKLMRNTIIVSAVFNILLNSILIPKYGISGAAIATAISLAMMNLVSAALVYWKLSIITLPISKGGFIREK